MSDATEERYMATEKQSSDARWIAYFREQFKLPRLLTEKEFETTLEVRQNTGTKEQAEFIEKLFVELGVDKLIVDSGLPTKYERVCFVCGKAMKPSCDESCAFDPHEIPLLPPSNGTYFRSSGNYGSTVFDPMTGKKTLHIVVCDDCLNKFKNRAYYVEQGAEVKYREVTNFVDYEYNG
jgi:hypothetical protein